MSDLTAIQESIEKLSSRIGELEARGQPAPSSGASACFKEELELRAPFSSFSDSLLRQKECPDESQDQNPSQDRGVRF